MALTLTLLVVGEGCEAAAAQVVDREAAVAAGDAERGAVARLGLGSGFGLGLGLGLARLDVGLGLVLGLGLGLGLGRHAQRHALRGGELTLALALAT